MHTCVGAMAVQLGGGKERARLAKVATAPGNEGMDWDCPTCFLQKKAVPSED